MTICICEQCGAKFDKVSKAVINYETNKVTAVSFVASLPSSAGAIPLAVGAATADITSYFVFIIRVVQELAYLYGFEEFNFSEDSVDSETMNEILIFMAVMFGVQGANTLLQKMADKMAIHVAKKLAQKALTKGVVYPVIKSFLAKIGVKITKQVFADAVGSIVPVAGSVISGGLTYIMFRPNCMKLRKTLMSCNLCDPEFYRKSDVIDV